jgi:hypothetical protein
VIEVSDEEEHNLFLPTFLRRVVLYFLDAPVPKQSRTDGHPPGLLVVMYSIRRGFKFELIFYFSRYRLNTQLNPR